MTNDDDVARLARLATDQYESIDVVACVAGVCCSGRFDATSLADHREQVAVNYLGAVAVAQAFLPSLRNAARRVGGAGAAPHAPTLLVVNSFVARLPAKGMSAYTGSKYALAGWTDAVRMELAGEGIHVAQVHPGVIDSDFLTRAQFRGSEAERREIERGVQGVMKSAIGQTPAEVAEACVRAVERAEDEVVVGGAFKAALTAYRFTGLNPNAARPM